MDPIKGMLRLMTHVNIGATLALFGWLIALAQPAGPLPDSTQTGARLAYEADAQGGNR